MTECPCEKGWTVAHVFDKDWALAVLAPGETVTRGYAAWNLSQPAPQQTLTAIRQHIASLPEDRLEIAIDTAIGSARYPGSPEEVWAGDEIEACLEWVKELRRIVG